MAEECATPTWNVTVSGAVPDTGVAASLPSSGHTTHASGPVQASRQAGLWGSFGSRAFTVTEWASPQWQFEKNPVAREIPAAGITVSNCPSVTVATQEVSGGCG